MRSALLVLAALLPATASAHEVGLSYGVYTARPDGLAAELTFADKELAILAEGLDADGDGHVGEAELAAASRALERGVLDGISVRAGTASCAWSLERAERVEGDGIALFGRARCPAAGAVFAVSLDFTERATPGHRHLVRAQGGGSPIELVAHKNDRSFSVALDEAAPRPSPSFASRLLLGVEHILTGYDHLLFLFGLVLVGGRARALIGVITAFTVAHSITLGLAALEVVAPSPRLIEPLIALSVAYVGVENWFITDASRRWPLTFAFGLIHGFGFAGALGEVHVPKESVPSLLLSFNLGVELGQLAVLAVVLPALHLARRWPPFSTHGVRAASLVIALFGVGWFLERVLG